MPPSSPSETPARRERFRPDRVDLGVLALIFFGIWGFYVSDLNPFAKNWGKSTFYERYYGVVVHSICNDRWESPLSGKSEALDEFLSQKRDSIRCEDLPSDLGAHSRLNYQAVNYYYLFKAVELTWRLVGKISWTGLDPLLGFFTACTSVCIYLIFRLGVGRLLSLFGMILFLPAHIGWAAHLRDYSKAPFFLLLFWLLGTLVAGRTLSPRRLYATCAAIGLVMGLGMGFRQDLMIAFPAVVATVGAFLPWSWRSGWRRRSAALALFLTVLALARWPATRFDKTVFTNTHVTLLGFEDQFLERLGIEDSLYEWVQIYSDPWIVFQFKSYAHYELGSDEVVTIYGREYSEVGRQLLLDIARRHPGDLLVRGYASMGQLLFVPWLFLAFSSLAVWRAPRQVIFTAGMIVFFTAYPAIQFHPRHYFHVEWVPLWLTAMILHFASLASSRWIRSIRQDGSPKTARGWMKRIGLTSIGSASIRPLARAAAFFAVVCLLLFVPLWLARLYQQSAVEAWLAGYESAAVIPLETDRESLSDETVRLIPDPFLERLPTVPAYHYEVGHLAVELDPARCGAASMNVMVRYEPGAYHDFSHRLEARDGTPTHFFVPIFSRVRVSYGNSEFLGLETKPAMVDCLSVGRVRDLERFPPIPVIELPSDWRQRRLYEGYAGSPGLDGYGDWIRRQLRRLDTMMSP